MDPMFAVTMFALWRITVSTLFYGLVWCQPELSSKK
jgi:hypothetical protein